MNKSQCLCIALGVSLAVITAPASAAKKGPRASLSATTVCAVSRDEYTGIIDSSEFNVTIRFTDKTSGSGYPVVTFWNVMALAKTETGNWDNQFPIGSQNGGEQEDLSDIEVTFSLCDLPANAKAVNAAASITYDNDSGGDPRPIENMCSDDPATDEPEPAGIKLSPEDLEAIGYLCPL